VRGGIVLFAGLALAGTAHAAPPAVTAVASPVQGVAPLRVTLTATGDEATYSWDLGDGTAATGAVVSHVYAPGRFTATVTATNAAGETALAEVAIRAVRRTVTLESPRRLEHGAAGVFAGSLRPAVRGARVQIYRGRTYVTSARVRANGRFRTTIKLRSPGPYHARYGRARSAERTVLLRPRIEAELPSTVPVAGALVLRPRLTPAAAGSVRIRVLRDGRLVRSRAGRLPTGRAGTLRVELTSVPRRGYAGARRVLVVHVVVPTLALGARGPSVLALERRLAELHYALRGTDAVYGFDTYEAVLAFQKVNGLPRTGRVEPWLWRRLARAGIPKAARSGDYLEVDKTRQVLFEVRDGRVARVIHVSTGATGNTPLGTWSVYRKVGGWDWVLWYPMYFKGGFAIHGYPSVPAYPASHGCVRIPMWIASSLFAAHSYGTTVFVHA
jgi:PKD domain/L,D-transpeptidase catalytic domain/Putative peptidoglycan binding domain